MLSALKPYYSPSNAGILCVSLIALQAAASYSFVVSADRVNFHLGKTRYHVVCEQSSTLLACSESSTHLSVGSSRGGGGGGGGGGGDSSHPGLHVGKGISSAIEGTTRMQTIWIQFGY